VVSDRTRPPEDNLAGQLAGILAELARLREAVEVQAARAFCEDQLVEMGRRIEREENGRPGFRRVPG